MWADHLVIIYPLWLGGGGKCWQKLLTKKSARIVVTMGMPAFIYQWYFGAHSLKNIESDIIYSMSSRETPLPVDIFRP